MLRPTKAGSAPHTRLDHTASPRTFGPLPEQLRALFGGKEWVSRLNVDVTGITESKGTLFVPFDRLRRDEVYELEALIKNLVGGSPLAGTRIELVHKETLAWQCLSATYQSSPK